MQKTQPNDLWTNRHRLQPVGWPGRGAKGDRSIAGSIVMEWREHWRVAFTERDFVNFGWLLSVKSPFARVEFS